MVEEFGKGSVCDDAALLDHDDAVAHGFDFLHDVGRKDDGTLLAEGTDERSDVLELQGVEARGGFVEDEQLRVVKDRLSQPNALAVAFGERRNGLVRFGREADPLYGVLHFLASVGFAFDAVQPRDEIEELADVHLWIEGVVFGQVAHAALEGIVSCANVLTVKVHGASIGGQVAQDRTHQGRLAGPIGPEQSHHLPAGH